LTVYAFKAKIINKITIGFIVFIVLSIHSMYLQL